MLTTHFQSSWSHIIDLLPHNIKFVDEFGFEHMFKNHARRYGSQKVLCLGSTSDVRLDFINLLLSLDRY